MATFIDGFGQVASPLSRTTPFSYIELDVGIYNSYVASYSPEPLQPRENRHTQTPSRDPDRSRALRGGQNPEPIECLAIAKSNADPAVPPSVKRNFCSGLYKYAHSAGCGFHYIRCSSGHIQHPLAKGWCCFDAYTRCVSVTGWSDHTFGVPALEG